MDILKKAMILGEGGRYDSCGPKMCEVNVKKGLGGIYHAKANHSSCRMLKTLMRNACNFDCKYCSHAKGCKKQIAKYKPEELNKVFMHLHKKMGVHGLFLSSAIAGDPDKVTEDMIKTIEILRYKNKFSGYVHFKVLPGTSRDLIKRAAELSDRMSVNIEAPNKSVMSELSSCKEYKTDLLRRQSWISRLKLRSGQTTQLIVNDLASDKDILRMAKWEYDAFNLKRFYFSAFRPVKGTALEDEKATPLSRQNRLYNVDFLMRDYGYKVKEFHSIMDDGMLPQGDPKVALARSTFDGAIDVNEASYEELIRIPGIGPATAKKIMTEKIGKYEDLSRFGARIEIAKPFIKVNGHTQKMLGEFC